MLPDRLTNFMELQEIWHVPQRMKPDDRGVHLFYYLGLKLYMLYTQKPNTPTLPKLPQASAVLCVQQMLAC